MLYAGSYYSTCTVTCETKAQVYPQ